MTKKTFPAELPVTTQPQTSVEVVPDMLSPEGILRTLEEAAAKNIDDANIASSNMVMKYLKFVDRKGEKIRLYYIGLTERKMIDYSDYSGEQSEMGMAVVFYCRKTDTLYVNMANQIVRVIQNLKRGTMLEITYLGLESTRNGRNMQNFKIVLLK